MTAADPVLAPPGVHREADQHGVVDRGDRDPVAGKDGDIVLGVLPDLEHCVALKQRPKPRQRLGQRNLRRALGEHVAAAVAERNVAGLARAERKADPGELGAHRVERTGLGVEGDHPGGEGAFDPALERFERLDAFVAGAVDRRPLGRGLAVAGWSSDGARGYGLGRIELVWSFGAAAPFAKPLQKAGEAVHSEERGERLLGDFAEREVVQRHRQRAVLLELDQHARQPRHLGHTTLTFKDICGSGKKAIPFGEVPLDRATGYAAEDAEVTWRLWKVLRPRLAEEAATRVYERVDRPLVPVVAAMERRGIKVDRDRLAHLSSIFGEETARLEQVIHGLAGGPFTIGSPKQLGEVLFDRLGYKGGRKGKSGLYSTDVGILEGLAGQGAEIATRVLEWRQLTKLRSTYTEALQTAINPATGRVHTSYSLVGAQTGRLSSNDPNLQNIPIRTELGRQIRDAFVAEPGNVLLAADYSQIELRLAAHMADVPALKEAFAAGEDIHARTAQEMFGEVTRETRGRAKTVNFAILYGISRWGLGGRLGIAAEEAQAVIDLYFQRFPGIQRYIHDTLESVRECGYSRTLFGRKTWFPRIKSPNQAERQGSERAAINAPIQGTSADIIKRAMARMTPALEAAGLGNVRMLLQVHDELVFELPEADVAGASAVIEGVMAHAASPSVTLTVPLGVEIGTGPSWGAAH